VKTEADAHDVLIRVTFAVIILSDLANDLGHPVHSLGITQFLPPKNAFGI
jgi:hypothetical protein